MMFDKSDTIMKFLDEVKLLRDAPEYNSKQIYKGMVGLIIEATIRKNTFEVIFWDDNMINDDIIISIKIEDLELVKDGGASDAKILDDLPKNNPSWWCKVEDGYILNLKGERKNKIPYDYNS